MKIYFIRHAKTNNNLNDIWQGRNSDLSISEEGYKELEELKKSLAINPDVFFSSPLKRAMETAYFICDDNKDKIITSQLLIERDFGQLEGKTTNYDDKALISDFDLNTDLDLGVEKIQDMYFKRIKPFLDLIKNKYQNESKTIFIISHSWVGRLIAFYASNEEDKEIIKKSPNSAVLYEFDI